MKKKGYELLNKRFEIAGSIKKDFGIDEETGNLRIEGYANFATKDRDGDIVMPNSYELANFSKNPIMLYQHDHGRPIGKMTSFKTTDMGLYVAGDVVKGLDDQAYQAIKSGVVQTFSIGFIGKNGFWDDNYETFYFTEIELLEVSAVSVPSQPNSTFQLMDAPCGGDFCMLGVDNATAKSFDRAEHIFGGEWKSMDKEEVKHSFEDATNLDFIEDAFLLVGDIADAKTWKFPHHVMSADGKTAKLSIDGMVSAWNSLKGADHLDDAARLDCAKHLLSHFEEVKEYDDIEIPAELLVMAAGEDEISALKSQVALLKGQVENLVAASAQTPNDLNDQHTKEDTDPEPVVEEPAVDPEVTVPSVEELKQTLLEAVQNGGEEDIGVLMALHEELEEALDARVDQLMNPEDGE
ncbi:MAG: HK97 family phage prohead protease [Deltaproteobacteria bacterium]|nr:MAG: HK97 family phage prohead protease [Deltaproteobacteria bacterium]